MNIKLLDLVWDLDLPTTAKLTLLAVAHLSDDDGKCMATVGTLMKLTSMAERTVRGAIGDLERRGNLITERDPGRATVYFVKADA